MKENLNVTEIRKKHNLTQPALAERAGVDVSTVWRWEHEGVPKRGPARAFLERLNSDTPQPEQSA